VGACCGICEGGASGGDLTSGWSGEVCAWRPRGTCLRSRVIDGGLLGGVIALLCWIEYPCFGNCVLLIACCAWVGGVDVYFAEVSGRGLGR